MTECYFAINCGYPSVVLDMDKNPVWCMKCSLRYVCELTPLKKLRKRKMGEPQLQEVKK